MTQFDVRGLEIHGPRMWDHTQVMAALDFMEQYELNTLIFHQNDLVDFLVFPEKYFTPEILWKRWPVRWSRTSTHRYYINNIIRLAHRKNIKFFAEIKEIYYDEWILELHPEVLEQGGTVCVTHPFWWEYLEAKLEELFKYCPDVDGIIVSPSTMESKLSISANPCTCDRCKNTTAEQWYYDLIHTMYKVMKPKGKPLVVRDFAYSNSSQTSLLKAAARVSKDIVISLKNTPHDFYPTFPTNPAIGNNGDNPEWVEFDTWGQFFGNGVFPVSIVEDMKERMNHCKKMGTTGIFLRTDWENTIEASAFNSMNTLNAIAGAMISKNPGVDVDDIYKEWACHYGVVSPMKPASFDQKPVPAKNEADYVKLRDFMKASWEVLRKSIYVRDHLFQDNSMIPFTLERCFAIMCKIHGMDDWKPGASAAIALTDENLPVIFAEKDQALQEVRKLPEILQVETLGLPGEMTLEIKEMLRFYEIYVRALGIVCRACFYAQKAIEQNNPSDREKAEAVIPELRAISKEIKETMEPTAYSHHIYRLLDHGRIDNLIENIEKKFAMPRISR